MTHYSRIIGCGSYLPKSVVTNQEMGQLVDTSDEWIRTRTGITQRHIASPQETTVSLATHAAENALKQAHLSKDEIDLIVVATTTPDYTFPSCAASVQAKLGIRNCASFDVQAVCAGFIYALATADSFLKTGLATQALVIGAETMSRILDWEDRTTCVLFGDGAGAVILRRDTGHNPLAQGFIGHVLHTDGQYQHILQTSGGVSTTGHSGKIQMNGQEVFKHAVEKMADSVIELLDKHHYKPEDLDWLVPHQANIRIIEATGKRLNLPAEKVITTVQKHANTSAASIPLALTDAAERNIFKPGDTIALTAIGGGLSWGASLFKW